MKARAGGGNACSPPPYAPPPASSSLLTEAPRRIYKPAGAQVWSSALDEGANSRPRQSYYHICEPTPLIATQLLKVTPVGGFTRNAGEQHRFVPHEPL